MGTGSTTQLSTHNVAVKVTNGTDTYTALPTLCVTVNAVVATVNVPDKVTCSLGGSSVPIVVTASAVPFSDIAVSLETVSVKEGDVTKEKSTGITPNAGETVSLKVGTSQGVLGFKCAAAVTGTLLKYKLAGTDKDMFKLSAAQITVTN